MKTQWRRGLPVWIAGLVIGFTGSTLGASAGTREGMASTRPDPGSGMVEVNRVDRTEGRIGRVGAMPAKRFALETKAGWMRPSPVAVPTDWPRIRARVFHTATITTPPEFPEAVSWDGVERRRTAHGHRGGWLPGKVHLGITDAAAGRGRHEHGPVVGRT
jgi:hypothetical protein